jgi:NAD(P)-dependent dehydrogenase (short-subunit alcohol dehydrogenase family)
VARKTQRFEMVFLTSNVRIKSMSMVLNCGNRCSRPKGRLEVRFANAGTARYAALGRITEELYDSIFNINVKGLLFTVQKALPLMPDGASIVLNASIVASKGLAANSVYSATKAAVRSLRGHGRRILKRATFA